MFMSTPQRFLPLSEVCNLVGLKKSAIYQHIKDGQFPDPIRIFARRSVWPENEIAAWQQEQIQAARPLAKDARKH
jgi:prophage regulatory protein